MVVYFDAASGDTHLVSDFAAHLIQKMAGEARPLELAEIVELVANDIEPDDVTGLALAIPDILGELTALDILAPL